MLKFHTLYPDKGCNEKGETPRVVSPNQSPLGLDFPLRALIEALGVSPSAEGDQRPTALDPCRLLKKAGENFHKGLVRTHHYLFSTKFPFDIDFSLLLQYNILIQNFFQRSSL